MAKESGQGFQEAPETGSRSEPKRGNGARRRRIEGRLFRLEKENEALRAELREVREATARLTAFKREIERTRDDSK